MLHRAFQPFGPQGRDASFGFVIHGQVAAPLLRDEDRLTGARPFDIAQGKRARTPQDEDPPIVACEFTRASFQWALPALP